MAQEEHKIAQDGQDKRQDEARWRQDAKNEGCIERFGPLAALGVRTVIQQVCEPRPRGGPPLRAGKPLPALGPKSL